MKHRNMKQMMHVCYNSDKRNVPFSVTFFITFTVPFSNVCRTRCCTLRHAKNTPTRSFVSNLYISQHSIPENAVKS